MIQKKVKISPKGSAIGEGPDILRCNKSRQGTACRRPAASPGWGNRMGGGSRRAPRIGKKGATGGSGGGVAQKGRCVLVRTDMGTKFLQLGWRQNTT